jgi:hypothetical protein
MNTKIFSIKKQMDIFSIFYNSLLGIYIYILIFLGYHKEEDHKPVESLIVINEDIEILDLTKETDKDNLRKYLKHHIMNTDDKFHPMYFFDGPLIVKFKYLNEMYQICLTQLESKNTDHSVIKKEPKYLSAIIKINENDDGHCITEQFVEFHGPTRNFFNHIPDVISDFSIILKNHKGKLHTFDMMGNHKVHNLN